MRALHDSLGLCFTEPSHVRSNALDIVLCPFDCDGALVAVANMRHDEQATVHTVCLWCSLNVKLRSPLYPSILRQLARADCAALLFFVFDEKRAAKKKDEQATPRQTDKNKDISQKRSRFSSSSRLTDGSPVEVHRRSSHVRERTPAVQSCSTGALPPSPDC